MASSFKRGQKLYFPFSKTYGETIFNAHLVPRYYKTKEAYDQWVNDPDAEMVEYGEIKHGNWVEKEDDGRRYCSVCGKAAFIQLTNLSPEYDYNWEEELEYTGDVSYDEENVLTPCCPYCGAEMQNWEEKNESN